MKDIYAIRLENARELLRAEHGGVQSRMAARLGMSRQLLSFYVGAVGASGLPRKPIGAPVARRMEREYKRPPGWMDNDHGELRADREREDAIDIPALESMVDVTRPSDAMQLTRLSKDWLRTHANFSSLHRLALLTAGGDAMTPTIEDGAILLVDQSYGGVVDNGVYAIARDGRIEVRRIAKLSGGAISLICDNVRYPAENIDSHAKGAIKVLGRVVAAWNTTRL